MGLATSAHHQTTPTSHEEARHPMACAALTLTVAAVFWVGLIWAAVRLYG
jgi:hypothetical protein